MSTTHVAGLDIIFGTQQRQRCAWCSTLLIDNDLTRVAVQVVEGEDPKPPATWQIGALITVDNGVSFVNEGEPQPDNGVKVPDDCCMHLPAEITAGDL